jgi:peptide/nickel transport system ATP-binding protein
MDLTDLLRIENLVVEYTTRRGTARALDRASITIEENKTLGLAGESGCGKSTLGRAIMRLVPYPGKIIEGDIYMNLDRPVSTETEDLPAGEINLMELDEHQMRALRGRMIAYIFQDPMTSLNPMLRIGDHFIQIMQAHDPTIKDEAALDRAKEILDGLGILPERVTDYPHQFSGGMRQRVMIGLGLALRPRLLISDEPTTSLDVIVEAQILEQMAELKEKFNLTMILITHNLGVLAQTADDIAIVYAGRIMEHASTDALFGDPQHPYTKALLDAVPDVSKPEKQLTWIPGAPPDLIDFIPGCMYNPRCPHAMDVCREKEPPLIPSKNGGKVACWLY